MIRHALKAAIRRLRKNRLFTLVNLAGLTVGLAACFAIATYLYHEASYDRQHPDAGNSYRLIAESEFARNEERPLSAVSFLALGDLIRNQVPEVRELVRMDAEATATMRVGDEVFVEKGFVWADPSVFDLFDVHLVRGSTEHALSDPNTVVLSARRAASYFGDSADPIGRSIAVNDRDLTVTGIFADPPSNTHFRAAAIGSMSSLPDLDDPWTYQGAIYLRLGAGADADATARKINAALADDIWWLKTPPTYSLQPLLDIHLRSTGIVGSPDPVDIRYLYLFGMVGVILLVCTALNYIGLAAADHLARVKEFGIQEVLGAGRKDLALQPFLECLLVCVSAAVLAVVLVVTLMPLVNGLLGTSIETTFFLSLPNALVLVGVVVLLLATSVAYPTVLASRSGASTLLKAARTTRGGRLRLRRSLVVVQFVVVIVLIVSVITVHRQLEFLGTERLGFAREQVVSLTTPRFQRINADAVKQELMRVPGVRNATVAVGSPFTGGFYSDRQLDDGRTIPVSQLIGDADYVSTLQIELLEGRELAPGDTNAVLVNEAMVRAMGWEEPIGQEYREGVFVAGVVRDFHLNNIHTPIHPASIWIGDTWARTILVRLDTQDLAGVLEQVGEAWRSVEPDNPLELSFVDEQFEALYHAEIQFRRLSETFSFIAILIACLGLYGFVASVAGQRTKEIGIRKVLGASAPSIVGLLIKDFLMLVVLATVVATPPAWWAMTRWLTDFAYRVPVAWWSFGLAGLAALAIAVLTVGWKATRAALANPVESLRYE